MGLFLMIGPSGCTHLIILPLSTIDKVIRFAALLHRTFCTVLLTYLVLMLVLVLILTLLLHSKLVVVILKIDSLGRVKVDLGLLSLAPLQWEVDFELLLRLLVTDDSFAVQIFLALTTATTR